MKKALYLVVLSMILTLVSCKKDTAGNKTITLTTTSVTLHYEDVFQIPAQCDSPITYTSNNEYHAQVTSSGLVTAKHVGTTTITLSSEDDTKTFTVIVNPRSNLYPEPDIEFGETKESVILKLGEPDITTNNGLYNTEEIQYTYNSTTVKNLHIIFDDNNCVFLYSILVYSPASTLLFDYLLERYIYSGCDYGTYFNTYYYTNGITPETESMNILLYSYTEDYWHIDYIPLNYNSTH
ncbi:MAG: Ig-like domain-containing protein [Bacteroidales bacterium]|nr:Ig-like domain-containing protein [Bacteroidales bacterium]